METYMTNFDNDDDDKNRHSRTSQTAQKPVIHASDTPTDSRRRKRSRSEFSDAFVSELYEDFVTHGARAIRKARRTNVIQYLKICAGLLPTDLNVKQSDDFSDLSDEELELRIAHITARLRQLGYQNRYIDLYDETDRRVRPLSLPKPEKN
jgi:hypothetical protein